MKHLVLLLLILYSNAFAAITDIKFGQYQIADSQWNVSACLYTTTCQIYSKQPGVAYKIPWTNGQLSWAAGDYVKFSLTGNSTNPYNAIQYTSTGVQKAVMGTGHIVNMGTDYFFFVGNDNNTGQLFSGSSGMNSTSGVTWTGTLNPTLAQADAYSTSYSTTPLSPGQTAQPAAPSLCCGGSSTSFTGDSSSVSRVQTFVNRTTQDAIVYIEQIGNSTTITVNQSGTRNNYFYYYGNGSNNTVNVSQTGNLNTSANYTELTVNGSSNAIAVSQISTGGTKGVFASVNNNSNTLNLQQKDSGNHYLSLSLSGGNKNVDVTQQGSASHMSNISLSGNPTDLSLTQSGSTQNFYSINHNCTTAGGCAKITVTQGQ